MNLPLPRVEKSRASSEEAPFDHDTLAALAIPHARKIAERYAGRSNGAFHPDDLFSAGLEGIRHALTSFNPSINPNFFGYADHIIRQYMWKEMRKLRWGLGNQLDRKKKGLAARNIRVISLDAASGFDSEQTRANYTPDTQARDPFDIVSESMRQEHFEAAVRELIPRLAFKERLVLEMLFYENKSAREISEELRMNINTIKSILRRQVLHALGRHLSHLREHV
ncbi:MAG: sigma-70 family RNA polymerase sigma factor [Patescibacteria group bacterium]